MEFQKLNFKCPHADVITKYSCNAEQVQRVILPRTTLLQVGDPARKALGLLCTKKEQITELAKHTDWSEQHEYETELRIVVQPEEQVSAAGAVTLDLTRQRRKKGPNKVWPGKFVNLHPRSRGSKESDIYVPKVGNIWAAATSTRGQYRVCSLYNGVPSKLFEFHDKQSYETFLSFAYVAFMLLYSANF